MNIFTKYNQPTERSKSSLYVTLSSLQAYAASSEGDCIFINACMHTVCGNFCKIKFA